MRRTKPTAWHRSAPFVSNSYDNRVSDGHTTRLAWDANNKKEKKKKEKKEKKPCDALLFV